MTGEFELIEKIRALLESSSSSILTGIGDDAAVVRPPDGNLTATVDMMVEGTHFDLGYTLPEELGHKALAINLSDMAAMGSKPTYALLSLGIRPELGDAFFEDFCKGLKSIADEFDVKIIGGNISACKHHLIVDIPLLGKTEGTGILRSGAKPGDIVAISGKLGLSAAGRQLLKHYGHEARNKFPVLTSAHLRPHPRVDEALRLRQTGVITSMIDISDGLSSELHHIGKASGVRIYIQNIPIPEQLREPARILKKDPLDWFLHGGEDYELLFTFKPEGEPKVRKILDSYNTPLSILGTVTQLGNGVEICTEKGILPLKPAGWDHLKKTKN